MNILTYFSFADFGIPDSAILRLEAEVRLVILTVRLLPNVGRVHVVVHLVKLSRFLIVVVVSLAAAPVAAAAHVIIIVRVGVVADHLQQVLQRIKQRLKCPKPSYR